MFLEILLQLMPLILELLKKDKAERDQSIEMGKVIQKTAMKNGNWQGILTGAVIQRLGRMTDDQQAVIEQAVGNAIAVQQAHEAAKGGE